MGEFGLKRLGNLDTAVRAPQPEQVEEFVNADLGTELADVLAVRRLDLSGIAHGDILPGHQMQATAAKNWLLALQVRRGMGSRPCVQPRR